MLSEIQKSEFNARAKNEIRNLLKELKITTLTDDNIGLLQDKLIAVVSGLVSAKEKGDNVDEKLIKIYDLITDIVLDNEEDLEFLNKLFMD